MTNPGALAGAVATVTELIPQLRNVMMRKEAEACTALLAALAEARKDSERLDWLEANVQHEINLDKWGQVVEFAMDGDRRLFVTASNVRDAIDAARTPQPETPE